MRSTASRPAARAAGSSTVCTCTRRRAGNRWTRSAAPPPLPATTTITAMGAPCGVKLRWDALQGRSTTWTLCSTKAGVELGTEEVVHTFFGQADDTTYACAGSELLRSGTLACRSGHGRQAGTVHVVGRRTSTSLASP